MKYSEKVSTKRVLKNISLLYTLILQVEHLIRMKVF